MLTPTPVWQGLDESDLLGPCQICPQSLLPRSERQRQRRSERQRQRRSERQRQRRSERRRELRSRKHL